MAKCLGSKNCREADPEAAEGALEVAKLIEGALGRKLGADEVSYLALHTSRLYVEMAGV